MAVQEEKLACKQHQELDVGSPATRKNLAVDMSHSCRLVGRAMGRCYPGCAVDRLCKELGLGWKQPVYSGNRCTCALTKSMLRFSERSVTCETIGCTVNVQERFTHRSKCFIKMVREETVPIPPLQEVCTWTLKQILQQGLSKRAPCSICRYSFFPLLEVGLQA